MQLKVSVVMCTYNGAEFIREQINSILKQTYPIYEFLIFDDASTDNTYAILTEYAKSNSLIKLQKHEKNIGYAANFKTALLAAAGDVIAIADQDDIWVNNKLERMIKQWNNNSLLIYCNSVRVKNNEQLERLPEKHYRRFEGTDARKISLFNTVSGHAMIIRKSLIQIAFPYPDSVYYDWWFAIVAAYNGGVSYVDETLVFQRVHTGNISINDGLDHTQKEQRFNFKRMVITHLEEFKKAPNMPSADKRFFEQFAKLMDKSLVKKMYLPLLFFMLKHSRALFFHKNKKIKTLSYFKYACRLTYNYSEKVAS